MTSLHSSDIHATSCGKPTFDSRVGGSTYLSLPFTIPLIILKRILSNDIGHDNVLIDDKSTTQNTTQNYDLYMNKHVSCDMEHETSSITECSTTCTDSLDESSLDSSSVYTCETETEEEIEQIRILREDPIARLTEYFAVVTIQDRWRECRRRNIIKQNRKEKFNDSHECVETIISPKAQILQSIRTKSAATLIQVKWKNYLARTDLEHYNRKQSAKKLRCMLARCEQLEDEFQSFFS